MIRYNQILQQKTSNDSWTTMLTLSSMIYFEPLCGTGELDKRVWYCSRALSLQRLRAFRSPTTSTTLSQRLAM